VLLKDVAGRRRVPRTQWCLLNTCASLWAALWVQATHRIQWSLSTKGVIPPWLGSLREHSRRGSCIPQLPSRAGYPKIVAPFRTPFSLLSPPFPLLSPPFLTPRPREKSMLACDSCPPSHMGWFFFAHPPP
jgi:hypothetical protein